jgi:hypothetical protein
MPNPIITSRSGQKLEIWPVFFKPHFGNSPIYLFIFAKLEGLGELVQIRGQDTLMGTGKPFFVG